MTEKLQERYLDAVAEAVLEELDEFDISLASLKPVPKFKEPYIARDNLIETVNDEMLERIANGTEEDAGRYEARGNHEK